MSRKLNCTKRKARKWYQAKIYKRREGKYWYVKENFSAAQRPRAGPHAQATLTLVLLGSLSDSLIDHRF